MGKIYCDRFSEIESLTDYLNDRPDQLQTVVGIHKGEGVSRNNFGENKQPGLFDYPDGEDVGPFLFELSGQSLV